MRLREGARDGESGRERRERGGERVNGCRDKTSNVVSHRAHLNRIKHRNGKKVPPAERVRYMWPEDVAVDERQGKGVDWPRGR